MKRCSGKDTETDQKWDEERDYEMNDDRDEERMRRLRGNGIGEDKEIYEEMDEERILRGVIKGLREV